MGYYWSDQYPDAGKRRENPGGFTDAQMRRMDRLMKEDVQRGTGPLDRNRRPRNGGTPSGNRLAGYIWSDNPPAPTQPRKPPAGFNARQMRQMDRLMKEDVRGGTGPLNRRYWTADTGNATNAPEPDIWEGPEDEGVPAGVAYPAPAENAPAPGGAGRLADAKEAARGRFGAVLGDAASAVGEFFSGTVGPAILAERERKADMRGRGVQWDDGETYTPPVYGAGPAGEVSGDVQQVSDEAPGGLPPGVELEQKPPLSPVAREITRGDIQESAIPAGDGIASPIVPLAQPRPKGFVRQPGGGYADERGNTLRYEGPGRGGAGLGGRIDADIMAAANANMRAGGGGGAFSAPAGPGSLNYTPEQWRAMSNRERIAANVAAYDSQRQAIRDLRNVRREAQGLPPVGTRRVSPGGAQGQAGGYTGPGGSWQDAGTQARNYRMQQQNRLDDIMRLPAPQRNTALQQFGEDARTRMKTGARLSEAGMRQGMEGQRLAALQDFRNRELEMDEMDFLADQEYRDAMRTQGQEKIDMTRRGLEQKAQAATNNRYTDMVDAVRDRFSSIYDPGLATMPKDAAVLRKQLGAANTLFSAIVNAGAKQGQSVNPDDLFGYVVRGLETIDVNDEKAVAGLQQQLLDSYGFGKKEETEEK